MNLLNRPCKSEKKSKSLKDRSIAFFFYFHEQHLFSCVSPLLLYYRELNMGRKAIFDVFGSFLRLWSQIWRGAQPPYKMIFWQYWDFIIPFKKLWVWFCKQALPLFKNRKIWFLYFKIVKKLTRQPLAFCLTTSHIVTSLWRHAMTDDINI